MQIISSGCFCPEFGQAGMHHSTSFSRKPSFAGTVRGFATTGDGKAVTEVVRGLIPKSER